MSFAQQDIRELEQTVELDDEHALGSQFTFLTSTKAQILTHCARQERAAMLELRDKTLKAQLEKVEGELLSALETLLTCFIGTRSTNTDGFFFFRRDF